MKKKWVGILSMILGSFLLILSCAPKESPTGEVAPHSGGLVEGPTEETKEKIYGLGEVAIGEGLEITITKAEKASEWINGPKEGREYVVVSFRVKNISGEEQSIGASDFQYVVNDTGSREAYERTTGVQADPDTFGGETILPGETFEGSLVYGMPIEMRDIEMHYLKSYQTALRFAFEK